MLNQIIILDISIYFILILLSWGPHNKNRITHITFTYSKRACIIQSNYNAILSLKYKQKISQTVLPATIASPNSYFCNKSLGRQAGWTSLVKLREAVVLYSGTRETFDRGYRLEWYAKKS